MEMDIEKKILRLATMTVAAACPAALTHEQPRHPSDGTPTPASTGEVLAQRISVSFAPLPSEQLMKQNVMAVLGGSHAQRRFGVAHQPADALQRGHGESRAEVLLGLG